MSDLKKVHIEVKEETAAPPQPAGSDEEEEEEDDEDEEDDDDEEDVSEEEAVKEVTPASQGKRKLAKESEDESSESDDDDGRTKEERLYDRAKRRIEVWESRRSGSLSLPFFPFSDFFLVSIETESRELEEHQTGHAESTGGVCAWTCRHRKDQNPGQGNI